MKKSTDVFEPVSNAANDLILMSEPYTVHVILEGTAKLLLHNWTNETGTGADNGKKATKMKRTDILENYVSRDEDGDIVLPTLNFCASIREAGKSYSDPTSPRKSMRDRLRAIIIPDGEFGKINGGTKTWEFVDSRRAVIQRAGITRSRPGFYEGWKVEFTITVLEPEYLQLSRLIELIENAGKFQALGDFRPTFGRYRLASIVKVS